MAFLILASMALMSAPVAAQRVVSTRIIVNAFGPAVIGLIENDTAQSVDVVSVSVTLLDANGNFLARQTGVPDLRVIAPGDRSPFTVPSFDPFHSAAATATVDLNVRPAEAPPEDLAVREVHAERSTAGTRGVHRHRREPRRRAEDLHQGERHGARPERRDSRYQRALREHSNVGARRVDALLGVLAGIAGGSGSVAGPRRRRAQRVLSSGARTTRGASIGWHHSRTFTSPPWPPKRSPASVVRGTGRSAVPTRRSIMGA
ncbi:MAG: FxLYD domain-containing protein [Trueperaceae bacterium]|nr:FxLYD domain-containing protein [Trueperaceae bacterium]